MLGANTQGLLLALLAALLWGALPVAVKQVLPVVDAFTLVWFRFAVAAIWLWSFPQKKEATLQPGTILTRRCILLLAVTILGLGANFVYSSSSVAYVSASACQILSQAGPVLLLLGGVFILKEPFLPVQVAGIVVLLLGLGLFFNTRLELLFNGGGDDFVIGVIMGLVAAAAWAMFGVAQKMLLKTLTPTQILRVIYPCCMLVLLPLAKPASLLQVNMLQLGCVIFVCLNTIIAYGAFTRAMSTWHAAKVSGILTTTPLFTLFLETLCHALWGDIFPLEDVNMLSYVGTATVMLGALGIAIGPMLHLPPFLKPVAADRKKK